MKSFRDAQDKPFDIRLTYGVRERVKARIGMDLSQPGDPTATPDNPRPSLVNRLATQPDLFVSLLRELIGGQFPTEDAREKWIENLEPETIAAARECFFEEWARFFRALGVPTNAEIVNSELELVAIAGRLTQEEIANTDKEAEIRRAIEKAKASTTTATTSTPESGASPESPESSPTT